LEQGGKSRNLVEFGHDECMYIGGRRTEIVAARKVYGFVWI
jgi:hypothetical protein